MIQLQLETVAICNAACIFCPYPTMTRQRGMMKMGLFEKIVDEAASLPLISQLTLTGLGETLLDKHLGKRLEMVRSKMKSIPLNLYTNGTYLKGEIVDRLIEANCYVYVSLNAASQQKRKDIMGLDDYDDVIQQIHVAQDKGLKLTVKAIHEKDLLGEDLAQFVDDWGLEQTGGNGFLHLEGNWAGTMGLPRIRHKDACTRAMNQIMVLWDGRVSLCCFDAEGAVCFGDLNKQTIKEVFNGELATHYRQCHAEGRRSELKLCDVCTGI